MDLRGSRIRLIYFNVMARGHPIRYLLHHAQIPFEDHVIPRNPPHIWLNYHKNCPHIQYRQLPVLQVNSNYISQQRAILRFLAKELGTYYPSTSLEAATVDALMDSTEDAFLKGVQYIRLKYILMDKNWEAQKDISLKAWKEFCGIMEKRLNLEGGEFLANGELSIADFMFFSYLRSLNKNPLLGEDFKEINLQFDRIREYYEEKENKWREIMNKSNMSYII